MSRMTPRAAWAGALGISVLCVLPAVGQREVDRDNLDATQAVPGELLVGFKNAVRKPDGKCVIPMAAAQAHAAVGATLVNSYHIIPCQRVMIPPHLTLQQAAEKYLADPNVEYAEPNYIVHALNTIPNDPQYGSLWGMQRIRAPGAWDQTTGSAGIVVAVIDTGIRRTHEDLSGNIWSNPLEIAGNGVDDDGNGYVDDVYGWDFCNNDNNPTDDNGHGTHCSGTIGAVGNNALGVVGVNWVVKLVGLKFLDAAGSGSTADAISAIQYAANTNLRIRLTSNSWGGGGYETALKDAIDVAGQRGQLFIAAAGNSADDNDVTPTYPGSYTSSNIISVAAIQSDGQMAWFSCYGKNSVDLAAPGVAILSTWGTADTAYNTISGTSMATPHVAGAAALCWALTPSLTWSQVKEAILLGVRTNAALIGKVLTDGELDLVGMLASRSYVSPGSSAAFSGEPYIGPYLPTAYTYKVENPSTNILAWRVTNSEPWLLVAPASFTLAPAGFTNVAVWVNENVATNLPEGAYGDTIAFSNLTTGQGTTTRAAVLRIGRNYVLRSTPYSWVDPAGHGQVSMVTGLSPRLTMPWAFSFYGVRYTNFWMSGSGMVGFDSSGLLNTNNVDIPVGSAPNAVLCPYWDGLQYMKGLPYIGYDGQGENQKLVLTWKDIPHATDNDAKFTFQALIRQATAGEDNDIIFQYQEVQEGNLSIGAGRSGTIGIEDAAGVIAREYSCNGSTLLANGQALLFTRNPSLDATPPTGVVSVVEAAGAQVIFEVRFDEIVTGLDAGDFTLAGTLSGTTISAVDGSGTRRLVTVSGISGYGSVILTMNAGAVQDLNGNPSAGPASAIYVVPCGATSFFDDTESGSNGWTVSSSSIWQLGTPTYGPPAAHSGTRCWGTVLNGTYPSMMNAWLKSQYVAAGESPALSFYAWYSFEAGADYGYVEATADGIVWFNITPGGHYTGPSGGWALQTARITNSLLMNRPIQIRFRATSNASSADAGLYVDDIRLFSAPPGVWVLDCQPQTAVTGSAVNVQFVAYNAATTTYYGVGARVTSPDAGVSITGVNTVLYGTMQPGQIVTGAPSVQVKFGPGSAFDANTIHLFHSATGAAGSISEHAVPFAVTGFTAPSVTNRLTAKSTTGVTNWLGQFLPGNGGPNSALLQVLSAGANKIIDPPGIGGSAGGDDRLLYTLGEGIAYGRFGIGGVTADLGQFVESFRHGLASGEVVYVRAWDSASFEASVAYGESASFTLRSSAPQQTNDFATWGVSKPVDYTSDRNGDTIADWLSIVKGLDPRDTIGPLSNKIVAVAAAGSYGSGASQMAYPGRVAVSSNFVFVADTQNNRIQVWNRSLSARILSYGSMGTNVGEFTWPQGLCLDPTSNRLVVTDTKNHRIVILDVNLETGALSWNTSFGGYFYNPHQVDVSPAGDIYVADTDNHRIQMFDGNGIYVMSIGSHGTDFGFLRNPRGVEVDSNGWVYVADTENNRIQCFDQNGQALWQFGANGSAVGLFLNPSDVQFGLRGRLYVADMGNNRIQVLDVSAPPAVTVIGAYGEGGSAAGQFSNPQGACPAPHEDVIYVADTYNHRVQKVKMLFDRDGDGMDDAWEDANGLDSSDPNDWDEDNNGDGFSNIGDYRLGLNPSVPFKIVALAVGPGNLRWNAQPGEVYEIEAATNLLGTVEWQLRTVVTSTVNGVLEWMNTAPQTNWVEYYRIKWVYP